MFRFDAEQRGDDIESTSDLTVQFPAFLGGTLDTVTTRYRKALTEAGISLPFVLRRRNGDTTNRFFRAEIKIDNGDRKPQLSRNLRSDLIEADFENPSLILLSKIQWQLFFAVVMIGITATAFIFLYRNLKMQQRLSDLKNDFIANITHELKTPIATVGVAIEALKNFDAMHDAARTKEYLDISGNELQRLNLLVDKVLRLSMLGEHKIELQQERVDMKDILQEVMDSMKLQFEKQGAIIHVETAGDNFTTVGDRLHLLSVFYNLLDNALKYSPKEPRIDISMQALEKQLVIKIADNGIGIANEHRHKIFDKFFRVPHGNTHNIKGYGLGLSYVQEVVLSHGGSIDVKSEEGKGSVFMVTLEKGSREW
jgi:two-component system phosphate regulon sensor histidine kinase PhoR